ncbi:MAG: MFS transporter [Chloroflexi bacterium]|nr:MFS transporter [Chloroflexota bacterium]
MTLFSFPISYLIDSWSRRKSIGIMAILWSLFTFLTGKAWNFWSILVPRALVGVGEAGYAPGGTAMIGAAFSAKSRGIAMGIFNMAIPLGFALGAVLGGMIAKQQGWQAPFLWFAIPGILFGILAFFMKDYKTAVPGRGTDGRISFTKSISSLIKIRTLRWVYIGFGLCQIMTMSFLFWAPAYIGRAWGVDVAAANGALAPIVLTAIIGAPLGGILTDIGFKRNPRFRMYLPAISMILSSVLLVGAIYFQLKGVGLILILAYGIMNVMAVPSLSAISQDIAPASQKGMVWGSMIFCQYFFGGGWSPYLVGAISNAMGQGAQALGTALMIAACGGILGGLCFLIAARPYPGDIDRVKGDQLMAE